MLFTSYESEYSVLSTHPIGIARYKQEKQVQLDVVLTHLIYTGLHPCLLDVALLCRPIISRKDREVSQQCASSTVGPKRDILCVMQL